MKRLLFAAAIVLLTAPVLAQDKNALATQYVNMPQVQNMITEIFSPTAMGDQIAAGLPAGVTLSADKKQRIGILMSEAINGLRPRMEDLMTSGIAEAFSAGELQALIDFYASEHGASVMRKLPPFMNSIMTQLQPDMQAVRREVTPKLVKILQE